jgi:hypothetical protein
MYLQNDHPPHITCPSVCLSNRVTNLISITHFSVGKEYCAMSKESVRTTDILQIHLESGGSTFF